MRYVLLSALLAVGALISAVGRLPAAPLKRDAATVNVTLPADAELTIDGQATRSTSGHRWFITPPLEAGQGYGYTFTARFVRGGKTITVEKRVWVRAGRETLVSLNLPSEDFASSELPNGYRHDYGAAADANSSYAAGETPGSGSPRLRRGPAARIEEGSYSPGFNPPHWGTSPSDSFYHQGEW